jgi:hypothetical protein
MAARGRQLADGSGSKDSSQPEKKVTLIVITGCLL